MGTRAVQAALAGSTGPAADAGEPERRWEEPERPGGAGEGALVSQVSRTALTEQDAAAGPIGGTLGQGTATGSEAARVRQAERAPRLRLGR